MALPQLLNRLEEAVPSGFIGMWSGSASTIPTGWALCDGTNGTPNLTDRFILGAGKAYQPGATGGTATATPSVAAGSAQTGIGLGTAAPGGTAGTSGCGLAIQSAALSIWTGAAGTGIGVQWSTLSIAQIARHTHSTQGFNHVKREEGQMSPNRTGIGSDPVDTGLILNTGDSQGHTHGISDPGHAHGVGSNPHSHGLTDNGHTHAVTTAAHGHTVTDGGHTHALTAQALSTLPPYYALCFIMKL